MAVKWVLQLLYVVNFSCFLHAASNDYPSTDRATSWTNNDLIPGGSSPFADGSIVRPVLLNNSNIAGYPAAGCGFYGNQNDSLFFFTAFVVQATSDSTFITTSSPQVLWTANRANPVRENATLRLTLDGDLVLRDANGAFVWSSNTSKSSVSSMNITGNCTLQLVDAYGFSIWQSTDHPTDTWLPDQILEPGQSLIASISASNWTPGPFYLSFVDNELLAFIDSDPPQVYHKVSPEGRRAKQFKTGRLEFLLTIDRQVRYISETENFQYLRLESDGHLRVHQWGNGAVTVVDDILTDSLGNCAYPTVCGNYGICSNGQQCTCPVGRDGDSSYFRPLNGGRGCVEVTQLSCQSSHLHSFLELDNVSYFGFTTSLTGVDMESCRQACLNNCSCKAALFHYDFNQSNGNCSLPSQIFSLMQSPPGVVPYNSLSFIKVQRTSIGPNPNRPNRPNPNVPTGPNSIRQHSRTKPNRIALILGLILAAIVILLLRMFICIRFMKRYGRNNNVNEELDNSLELLPNLLIKFTYRDLKSATGNFRIKLGGGGFGSVFEGTSGDGTKIAVKRLDQMGQGREEFLAEVKTIGSIHHVNLVRLMGFCAEKSHKLLVYEYMSNGSLDKWIFNRNSESALGWEIRTKVILNIAKGLAYLHEECRMRIAHLDVKPQNILLDDNFNAKLSDFGLARLIDRNQSQVITQMRGTRGYMAPEWLSRKITEKVDVYSFGVVILEVVCGRRNLDFPQPDEDDYLLLHIVKKKAEENRLLDLVDKSSEDMQQHGEAAVKMIRIAIWCLQSDFTIRPPMSMVVKVLEGAMELEPISDYSFLTPTVVEAPREAILVASNPPPAMILSGPR